MTGSSKGDANPAAPTTVAAYRGDLGSGQHVLTPGLAGGKPRRSSLKRQWPQHTPTLTASSVPDWPGGGGIWVVRCPLAPCVA